MLLVVVKFAVNDGMYAIFTVVEGLLGIVAEIDNGEPNVAES